MKRVVLFLEEFKKFMEEYDDKKEIKFCLKHLIRREKCDSKDVVGIDVKFLKISYL